MLEASDNPDNLQRKNHCLIREPDANAELLKISDDAIEHYCHALTTFQKGKPPYEKNPFNENLGVLMQGRAIFYCQPQQGKSVTLFGQSPNFRIPYSSTGDGRAASAVDFVPDYLHNAEILDIAEAIFGYVRNEKQKKNQARAGRVFISDAICERTAGDDIWLKDDPITPKILASPKPTTFQQYLVQTDPEARKRELKHYANKPEAETVIRGHKLYWHKGRSPSVVLNDPEASESQTTQIKPIQTGVSFTFTIDFENLTDVELGAILWVLNIAQKEEYRLSIGMGKPLGMGAIKITHQLHLSDRKQRYKKLFQDNNWHIPERYDAADTQDKSVKAFEKYVLNHISEADQPNTGNATTLEELPRIKMLLAMLSWSGISSNEARYMEIERTQEPRIGTDKNEYKERPVLPTPLQVIGWEDNRKINTPNPSPQPKAKVNQPVLKKSKSPTRRNKEDGREDKGSGNPFARPPKPPKRRR